jgi:6-phosphofructokinase 2
MQKNSTITLTLNPAIDKSAMVDTIIPEAKLRCYNIKSEPGGGGINVSKALKKLGANSIAIFPCGGHNGNLLKDLLTQEDIPFIPIETKQETRENFIVLETSTNNQFRFGMPGADLDETIATQCLHLLSNLKEKPAYFVASGSLPAGIHQSFYADVAKLAKTSNTKFILDTSGNALQLAANEGVYLLKPNIAELCNLLGVTHIERDNVNEAAMEIIKKGNCEVIVVSLGAEGAVLVTKDFYELVPAPKVKKLSTVGAGDSMVAGMVHMLMQNRPLTEVVKFGVACGSAATMNPGTQLFNKQDALTLFKQLMQ